MKHRNLKLLRDRGINVPNFITLLPDDPIDLSFSASERFAVRSSFDAEDGLGVSFAGQFSTFLNVERKNVELAVKKVAESKNEKGVREYESARSVSLSSGIMHIIVQEMVDAELSGIIFTANPLGILNETVVVVGEGLGNNVVEDKVLTTSYFYNRDDGIYCFERQGNSPLLDDAMLKKLLSLSEEIKKILGYDSDIEFAIKDGVAYILQARPITTLKAEHPIILDNSNIVESYPGVSLPLTQDFVKEIYHGIFKRLVLRITEDKELTDKMDCYLIDMVDTANWRIYYRISNWYAVLKLLPFSKKIISVWQNMMGVSNTLVTAPDDIKIKKATRLRVLLSFIHYLFHTPKYMKELNESFDIRYSSYRKAIEASETPEELLLVYERIKKHILSDWDLTLVNDMYTFVYTALAGKRNKELLANVKNLESMKPVLAINHLVKTAEEKGLDSDEYRKRRSEYIELYGDRCLCELKLETKTYRTNPERLDEYVKGRIGDDEFAPDANASSEHMGNFFAKRAKRGIRNREISRLNRSKIFGLSREIFLKIGEYLASSDLIEAPRDVFYLKMDELLAKVDLKRTVAQRKAQKLHFDNIPSFGRLVFAEKIINRTESYSEGNVFNSEQIFYGTPSSVGRAVGEVLVIEEPDEGINTSGKILVTKSTDPGWVFLIRGAIGIIAEKGSLLSHTAIISRELGKPAVVGVKDCTKLLKNGDRIELNAYDGTVKLLGDF